MSGHDKNRVSSVREEDPIPKGVRGHKRQALKRSIKSRHMFMIALAGVIGTGLFLGTGDVINRAGRRDDRRVCCRWFPPVADHVVSG